MNNEFERDLLRLFAAHDCCDKLHWDRDLTFYVSCNNFFFPNHNDSVKIETDDDMSLLIQCFCQTQRHAVLLYCARKRGMRPQGECYKRFMFELAVEALFDDCGPWLSRAEREKMREK